MAPKETLDLREALIDAHAHFFFLKGQEAMRLRLWQILSDAVVIDRPVGAPMRRTVLGYIPTLDGNGVYEIEGTVSSEPLPDQMPDTIRIDVDPSTVRLVNRRLYPRVSFAPPLEATATADEEKTVIPAKIVNFSAGGLRVETPTALSPARVYTFRFIIETEDETHDLNLAGMIIYELPLEAGHAYGVRFGRPSEAKKAEAPNEEAPVESLERTVDLLGLVNRLLVREG
ncbi:MAG: PilZ domain-containing protein [Pseudomonadota bacterium]